MTERLADINARIDGVHQLGAVVNAMRGIAAARAQQARGELQAVDAYAEIVAGAIGRTLGLLPLAQSSTTSRPAQKALVLFCAEQGFAGAFSERILDSIGTDFGKCKLFLVGTRGGAIAAERGVQPGWKCAMPSHSGGIPKLANRIAEAVYGQVATGEIDQLDAIFAKWIPAQGVHIERRRLFPLDVDAFDQSTSGNPPLVNLAPETLLSELTADYIHAKLCEAALHSFSAENEARMEAMALAHNHVERQLGSLRARQRQVRQEEITAEIIELATGETASRSRDNNRS